MKRKMKSQVRSSTSRAGVEKSSSGKSLKKRKSCLLDKTINCPSGRICQTFKEKNICCKDLSDLELVNLISLKNKDAYNTLSERYYKKLFTYIFHFVTNKDEAEDILQNVFSKAYKNIDKFDVSRKFSSWIYRIAHNESVNYLKRRNKHYIISWDDITTTKDKLDTAVNEEIPEEKWVHTEVVREIDEALEKLPAKYKQVLKLRYFQEYSYEEISYMLNKPVNTIGTLINRAKKKLLEVAQEMGIEKQ